MDARHPNNWPSTPPAALYAAWRPGPWPYPASWPGRIGAPLVRDWREVVASASGRPELPGQIAALLRDRGVQLADEPAPAAWLALQDTVLEQGFAGDASRFAAALGGLVAERVPRLARLAIRALPLGPALQRAASSAGELLPGPPPSVEAVSRGFVLRFADLDLYRQPTFAVWAAAQAEAAWALTRPGMAVSVDASGPLVLGFATR